MKEYFGVSFALFCYLLIPNHGGFFLVLNFLNGIDLKKQSFKKALYQLPNQNPTLKLNDLVQYNPK
ncbi:hypothetical protein BpHYR1_054322 [Brachionus plicatilis]|uniref:Uncharacterized protein n=1 Tax=Brachionus plicatilis TaxID=10195 RepID=A0A3M7Q1U6_BRAPC|nr:hypothetical protein BpHYR1_054322 [Brachionus plicatilis]